MLSHVFHHGNWKNMNWMEKKKSNHPYISSWKYFMCIKEFCYLDGGKQLLRKSVRRNHKSILSTSATFAVHGRTGEFGTDFACLEEHMWKHAAESKVSSSTLQLTLKTSHFRLLQWVQTSELKILLMQCSEYFLWKMKGNVQVWEISSVSLSTFKSWNYENPKGSAAVKSNSVFLIKLSIKFSLRGTDSRNENVLLWWINLSDYLLVWSRVF